MSFSTIKAIAFTAVFAAATPLAYAQSATELEEDFSLFTAGSESEPSGAISNETGTIPSSYFHQSGWSGYGVHQAGGACALISPDNYGAQLYTPLGAYIGEYEVKVRAKTLASNYRDNAQLTIGLWEDAATQYNQTPYHEPFTTTKSEWREFTFYFNNTSYNSSNLLIAFSTLDKVLIDDVKISRPTTLTAPTPAGISGFKADGFTAHWNAVNGATHYLFSLFHDVKEGESEEQTFLENFTSMKTSGKLPEGWGYKSQSGKEPEFFEKSADGIKGALLFKNGDVITMPDNGGYYNTLEINIVECKMPKNAEEIGDAQIIVELFDGHAWKKFTTIYVDASDYGQDKIFHDFDWTRFVTQDKYKCTSVRFRLAGFPDDCALGLTDMAWSTKNTTTTHYDIKDKRVEGTSFTVDGLDPSIDYSFVVKACNAESTSPSSEAYEAIGVAAPVAESANDVRKDSYTANWQLSPKAETYYVENNDLYTAPADAASYVVINEDFSKISGSGVTIDKPYAFQNGKYEKVGLDMVYNNGWECYWGGYADGCFVCTGMTDYNISGELVTPQLTLNNDGGSYQVKVKARSMLKDETLIVYSKNTRETKQCQLNPDDWSTFTLNFTAGQLSDRIAFTCQNHYPFIIDEIKITQNLKAGDRVYTFLDNSEEIEEEETSYTLTQLAQPKTNHTYAYRVYGQRMYNNKKVVSAPSDYVTVDFSTGINKTEAAENATEVARYTVDGVKVGANARGVVLVKYADGSVKKQVK